MEFVNPHNVKRALDTLCHAESFNVSSVVEKCMGVIASYMQNMTGGYMSRLTAKQLIQLVSRDDIVVNDEFALLNKVEHWYGNESQDDSKCSDADLKRLLSLIRFEHMNTSQLRNVRSMKLGAFLEKHQPEVCIV